MSDGRKPMTRWAVTAVVVAAAAGLGWYVGGLVGGGTPEPAAQEEAAQEEAASDGDGGRIYRDVAGRVVRLAPEDGVFTVDHERIEGFMPAMTMDLEVVEPAELEGLEPEDAIHFDLVHVDGRYQAVRIRRAGDEQAAADRVPAEGAADALGPGDLVPDLELYNSAGERFRLREMEPRHKVITFFYARCPLETFCPAQSRRLAELQQHIVDSGSEVHLVSLTLDAEHDGPGVLEGYAERFEANPSRWTLAGGDDAAAIRRFADRTGARIDVREQNYEIDHALIGLRVDGDRIVDRVYGLEAIVELVQRM